MSGEFYVAKKPGIPGFSAICVCDEKPDGLQFIKTYGARGYLVSIVSGDEMKKGVETFINWRDCQKEPE